MQAGSKLAAGPAPSSTPGPSPLCRSSSEQVVASGIKADSRPPTGAVHLGNEHSPAATSAAPSAGVASSAAAGLRPSQAGVPDQVSIAQSASPGGVGKPALGSVVHTGVTGSAPVAATLRETASDASRQATASAQPPSKPLLPGTCEMTTGAGTQPLVMLAEGGVSQTTDQLNRAVESQTAPAAGSHNATAADAAPEAACQSPTGPSATSLARRAAQYCRHKRTQAATVTAAPAAANSLQNRTGSPASGQHQRSESLPSPPLPRQPLPTAVSSLQASPQAGQLAITKDLNPGSAVPKTSSTAQPTPAKGPASGLAAVPEKGGGQPTPENSKANKQASGLAAADDQNKGLESAIASLRIPTTSMPNGLAAADAVDQHKGVDSAPTSPRLTLTNTVPKAQRRQRLQQDSSKRRKQVCMDHLKDARLATINLLRAQNGVGVLLAVSP